MINENKNDSRFIHFRHQQTTLQSIIHHDHKYSDPENSLKNSNTSLHTLLQGYNIRSITSNSGETTFNKILDKISNPLPALVSYL